MYEFFVQALAACLVGGAVKLMDDRLDAPTDKLLQRTNWSLLLGRADLPYALVFFALATAFSPSTAVTLFLASYAVGMADSPGRLSPLGMPYWLEAGLAVVFGCCTAGAPLQFAALFTVSGIQAADDLRDAEQTQQIALCNRTQLMLVTAVLTLLALLLRPALVVGACTAYIFNEVMASVWRREVADGSRYRQS
jgi:lysylphosphatidylglycerol synthetase-like protein (DUF2156 family)